LAARRFPPPVFGRGYVSTQFVLKAAKRGCMLAGSDRTNALFLMDLRFDSPDGVAESTALPQSIVWGAKAKPPVFLQ